MVNKMKLPPVPNTGRLRQRGGLIPSEAQQRLDLAQRVAVLERTVIFLEQRLKSLEAAIYKQKLRDAKYC